MKLTYFQLEQHLGNILSPVYLISGDELLLKQDAIQWIRKAAKKAGFQERVRLTPGAQFDWDQLYQTLYATSFFSETRLIELDCRESLPNKQAAIVLTEYAKRASTDQILLIDAAKLDLKISKSSWYQALEKIGVSVAAWPIPRDQLPQWIMQRAKKYKLSLHNGAAKLIADYVEGNLSAAAQMIEKIFLLRLEKDIDQQIVQQILTDETRFTIFDLTETILLGDREKVLHVLKSLENDGTEPTLILWQLTRELRILSDIALQYKQGSDFESLFQKNKIFARKQTLIRQYLKKYSAEDCWKHLSDAFEIDKIIKGAAIGHAWDHLQLFCLKLV